MRKLRNSIILGLVLAATTSFAASTTQQPQFDGGDPPPLCVPGDPGCKP